MPARPAGNDHLETNEVLQQAPSMVVAESGLRWSSGSGLRSSNSEAANEGKKLSSPAVPVQLLPRLNILSKISQP
jgi:hypothetical protein